MTKTVSQKNRARAARANNKTTIRKQKTNKKPKLRVANAMPSLKKIAAGVVQRVGNAVIPGLGDVGAGLFKGSGDYSVQSNSLHNGMVPSFATLDQPYRFRYREFLGVVNTATSYSVLKTINLNPGLLCPILSQISESFTMYKFHGLVFTFNSTSANAVSSTNTALGVMGMVTNYDPTQVIYQTRQQAEEAVGCVSAVPAMNLYHPVECKPKTTLFEKRWLRYALTDTSHPLGETDLGTFQLFSDGAQAASAAGELWVAYDVEFYLPRIAPTQVGECQAIQSINGSSATGIWNVSYEEVIFNTLFSVDAANSRLVFTDPGQYRVIVRAVSTAATATPFPAPTVVGGSLLTSYFAAGYVLNGGTDTDHHIFIDVDITTPGGTLAFGATTMSLAAAGCEMHCLVLSTVGLSKEAVLVNQVASLTEKVEALMSLLDTHQESMKAPRGSDPIQVVGKQPAYSRLNRPTLGDVEYIG